jgi:hypothetical protein
VKFLTDINHLENLKILNASTKICSISDDSISNLRNIEKIVISYNNKITNLNHLT